ncbi:MAG: MBL fold metallo-hydrolase [Deltaproteobacteria bacterium]|nr:MBL fold metallo-hydrolase [Deltaproteobacteria bacterium]
MKTNDEPVTKGKLNIGEVKSLKVEVLSETGWFDNEIIRKNMMDHGGMTTSQYEIPWDPDNAGGYSALITVVSLDDKETKILLDTGWSNEWMNYVFTEKSNVAEMLKNDQIDFMVLSHWHLDHFWGIESTLKHKPDITLYAPYTCYPEDMSLLKGERWLNARNKTGQEVLICKNDTPHTGKLILCAPEGEENSGIYKLMPGVALKMFDVPIILRVRGENVLYFNVKDKGFVTVTGCGHPGVLSILSFARDNFGEYKAHGCYGGLHIAAFEQWDPKFDELIEEVKSFNMTKMGCNHCTGWIWAEKATTSGLPIIKGTDKYKTYTRHSTSNKGNHVFLTNGDSVVF